MLSNVIYSVKALVKTNICPSFSWERHDLPI